VVGGSNPSGRAINIEHQCTDRSENVAFFATFFAWGVKEDWSGIGSDGLLTSLLADARAGRTGALERIRFYYPKEYELQRAGDLRLRIEAFEAVALNRNH
jgi:hypothetical protein